MQKRDVQMEGGKYNLTFEGDFKILAHLYVRGKTSGEWSLKENRYFDKEELPRLLDVCGNSFEGLEITLSGDQIESFIPLNRVLSAAMASSEKTLPFELTSEERERSFVVTLEPVKNLFA